MDPTDDLSAESPDIFDELIEDAAQAPCFCCGATSEHVVKFIVCDDCRAIYPLCLGCYSVHLATCREEDLEALCPTRLRELIESLLRCDDCSQLFFAQLESAGADAWYISCIKSLRETLIGDDDSDCDECSGEEGKLVS